MRRARLNNGARVGRGVGVGRAASSASWGGSAGWAYPPAAMPGLDARIQVAFDGRFAGQYAAADRHERYLDILFLKLEEIRRGIQAVDFVQVVQRHPQQLETAAVAGLKRG